MGDAYRVIAEMIGIGEKVLIDWMQKMFVFTEDSKGQEKCQMDKKRL